LLLLIDVDFRHELVFQDEILIEPSKNLDDLFLIYSKSYILVFDNVLNRLHQYSRPIDELNVILFLVDVLYYSQANYVNLRYLLFLKLEDKFEKKTNLKILPSSSSSSSSSGGSRTRVINSARSINFVPVESCLRYKRIFFFYSKKKIINITNRACFSLNVGNFCLRKTPSYDSNFAQP
jgi:hypothetical protein